jgi:glutathione S-transferase
MLTLYEHPFALYCQKVYGMLETQLAAHEFLAGDHFTIADCAAAPLRLHLAEVEDQRVVGQFGVLAGL